MFCLVLKGVCRERLYRPPGSALWLRFRGPALSAPLPPLARSRLCLLTVHPPVNLLPLDCSSRPIWLTEKLAALFFF